MPSSPAAAARLASILRAAYSAELAAYIAYHGHERSVRDPVEKVEIRRIARDELHHRRVVGDMLAALGAAPSARRERWMPWVGRLIWVSCFAGGWFVPMYGAARLENGNVEPYVEAARLALAAGRPELVEELLAMAEVEWDHEAYFHRKARSHWLMRVFPDWDDPSPRAAIRAEFAGRVAPAAATAAVEARAVAVA
jgi:hypothetical protein